MIQVTQKYNTEMYKKAMRVLLRRTRYMMLIFGLVILGFSIAFYFDSVIDGVIFTVLGLIVTSLYFVLPLVAMKANRRNKDLKQIFTFSQEGVKIDIFNISAGEQGAICVASYNNYYHTFYDIREIDGVVYLFLNKTTAFLIDSRNFPTEADKLMVIGYFRAARQYSKRFIQKK